MRYSLFTPPRFLSMPTVGVDISDRSIKYVALGESPRGRRLSIWGDKPLPEGVVDGGKILSIEKVVAVLTEIREQHNISCVRAALPEEQIYFFNATIPAQTEEEVRTALELSLEEHVPILAQETVFDFKILAHTEAGSEVAVVAAPRSLVDSYIEVFEKAGMTLLALETEPEAIARSVVPPNDETVRLVIDFGDTRTGIAVVEKGEVRFTSTIAMGGAMLTQTLAKHFNVSFEEAEKMKRSYGLQRNTENQDLFSLLLNNIAVLRDEVNRHFIYWHTHADERGAQRPPIEQIVLVGGDSNLMGLPSYLATSLHVPTVIGDVWQNVSLEHNAIPEITKNDSLGYATAIGLSLATYE